MKPFKDRVNFAAQVIRNNGKTTRKFDDCFECNDGDQVVMALVRRAEKTQGKLLANLPIYVSISSIDKARKLLGLDLKDKE